MTDATAETLDLSRLPAGNLLTIDFEAELATRKTLLAAEYTKRGLDFTVGATELDPAVALLEATADRYTIAQQAINDAGLSNQLAHAIGGALDQLGANVGCYRQAGELDPRYQRRIQLWNERLSTGSRGYYVVQGLTAVPTLADISVVSFPGTGGVVVTAMGSNVDPTPSDAEMAALRSWLFSDAIMGATHELTVQPVQVLSVPLVATLEMYDGPDPDTATSAALANLAAFLVQNKRLGRDLLMNAWLGRLQTDAVYRAVAATPLTDTSASPYQVVFVPSITVTPSGITGQ